MAAQLSSRERVLRSVAGGDVDRIPALFRAEPELRRKLEHDLGPGDLAERFGADTVHAELVWEKPRYPDLSGATSPGDVEAAGWPNADVLDVEGSRRAAAMARATGRAVTGGVWASIFTEPRRAMGEEKFLVEMCLNAPLVERVVGRFTDFFLAVNRRLFDACTADIDIFYFGSDFGTQKGLFISPEHYRRFFKPEMRRLVEQAKGYGQKVMFHTCGAVAPIVNDLIEIGVDILDPVQVSAAGMEPAGIADEFKGRIAFHGAVSTQTTLPFGTADDVREEVRRAIDILGPSAFVAGPDQEMIGDIPTENVVAMYEAIRDHWSR